jgi:hypothetical protein
MPKLQSSQSSPTAPKAEDTLEKYSKTPKISGKTQEPEIEEQKITIDNVDALPLNIS